VPPKQDQELKFATTYVPKLTSHAHVHQELARAATESENDFYKILTLNKAVKIIITFFLNIFVYIIFVIFNFHRFLNNFLKNLLTFK
jgi:hypothetical protein